MKLQTSVVTSSPFSDMEVNAASAPAVMALYNIKIIAGSTNKSNQLVYNGSYAIKRCDFAIIIWRVQNYVKTGNVSGLVPATSAG